jgi:Fic family protein
MKLPATPPLMTDIIGVSDKNRANQNAIRRLMELMSLDVGKDRDSDYLHWDKMRYKKLPDGVQNHEEWWLVTKFRRSSAYRKLPFLAKDSSEFVYWLPDPIHQLLHQVDQQASGRVKTSEEVTNTNTRNRYLVNSLIEEAITSSQLEGASTTYKVAKAMLRESRQPRDNSERMIVNNYRAMTFIKDTANEQLTKELLLDLHRIVTEGTLEDPTATGRFRNSSENIAVYDNRDNSLLHEPPIASEIEKRMDLLCEFANSSTEEGTFLHPVIKSILLHFMLGYDHPFVDGNGRTARALFYWSMARHGYWMMEFVSISSIIKERTTKYTRAYLYSENDDNDTTYFIDFKLKIIIRAIERLQSYLAKKTIEIQRVENVLGSSLLAKHLNYRQLSLISHALRNPGELYTIESHRKSHNVTYPTARADLMQLVKYKLLKKRKIGKAFVFQAIERIEQRMEELKLEMG